jgi:hypothetical protein
MRQRNRCLHAATVAAAFLFPLGGAPALARPEVGPEAFSVNATLLNFDELDGGTTLQNGEVLSTQYAHQGVVFVNPSYTSRASMIAAILFEENSDPNVIYADQGGGSNNNAPPQEIVFSVPVSRAGFWFGTGPDDTVHLQAWGQSGLLEEIASMGALLGPNFREGFIGIERPERITMVRVYSRRPTPAFFVRNFEFDDVRFEWACYPDCTGPGGLTVADFGCFQTRFVAGDRYADCDADNALTVADFGCFQTRFVAGCP